MCKKILIAEGKVINIGENSIRLRTFRHTFEITQHFGQQELHELADAKIGDTFRVAFFKKCDGKCDGDNDEDKP